MEEIKCALTEFAGNTKLGRISYFTVGKALQKDLYRLNQCAKSNIMTFNKVSGTALEL